MYESMRAYHRRISQCLILMRLRLRRALVSQLKGSDFSKYFYSCEQGGRTGRRAGGGWPGRGCPAPCFRQCPSATTLQQQSNITRGKQRQQLRQQLRQLQWRRKWEGEGERKRRGARARARFVHGKQLRDIKIRTSADRQLDSGSLEASSAA